MNLTEQQRDALGEFINIAFSRTASSLSEISGKRVLLDVPQVEVYPIEEVAGNMSRFLPGDVASIHQPFDGAIAGDAFLILNYEGAVRLTDLLTETSTPQAHLDESARQNVVAYQYPGGHAMYTDPRAHLQLRSDVTRFIREAVRPLGGRAADPPRGSRPRAAAGRLRRGQRGHETRRGVDRLSWSGSA